MVVRYVPNLRFKGGEKTALRRLTAAGKENVVPLILVGADQFKSRKQTKSRAAVLAPEVLAQEIADVWGASPFYLDSSRIHCDPANEHALGEIAQQCRSLGLYMLPVANPADSEAYARAVRRVIASDSRGCCLRISSEEMTSMSSWLQSWPLIPTETDLLVDFGDSARTALGLATALAHEFQRLHRGAEWRTVSIVATSMPTNFSDYPAGVHHVARAERTLWSRLVAAGLPYELSFGDYATVSTAAAPPNIRWGYPITVRYSRNDDFVICRGVKTRGKESKEMGPQLVGHARSIAKEGNRGALPHCWADAEVDAIATGTHPPKGLEHWVSIGVNRHIELTRSILT